MRGGARLRRATRSARARWSGAARNVTIGAGTQIRGRLEHSGSGSLEIGTGCRIGMGLRPGRLVVAGPGRVVIGANCTIDAAEIHTLDPAATVIIGDGCYLNRVEIGASTSVTFGQRCEVGSALIYDTDFHSVQRVPRGTVRSGPIVLGDDVWVGARTAILRGVMVGSRCVIGLGAVVTRDVAADTLVRPADPRLDSLGEQPDSGTGSLSS